MPTHPEAIKVVNICDLLITLFGPNHYSTFHGMPGYVDYSEQNAAVMKWCKENNAHYYAADREDFSQYEAKCQAAALNLSTVVVEDLS